MYFILDLVADLDLGEIERRLRAKDHRGERPYSPRMITALLLYGYAVGVFSSRKIERATFEDVAFRVLAAGEHPHFTTIDEFRATHRTTFADLFQQVLKVCMSAGLVKLGRVAIDGTKMKANASKHKAMSYDRMANEEARLSAEVEQLIAQAEAIDDAEDKLYGVGQQPRICPPSSSVGRAAEQRSASSVRRSRRSKPPEWPLARCLRTPAAPRSSVAG